MSANSFRLRYGCVPGSYTRVMKTLTNSLSIEVNDPARFRLKVLEHAKEHGVSSALSAYGISRRTYYYWLSSFKNSQGKLVSLVPKSTRPKRTRRMVVDERLLLFIRSIREEYGRIGKEKLKVLLDAYAKSLGIKGYSAGKIGKIIKRHRYYFDRPKKKRKPRFARHRVRRVPKDVKPGYIEMDSVILYVNSHRFVFVTVVDVVTKVAYTYRAKNHTASEALVALEAFIRLSSIPVHSVQTDNGSEFLGVFHKYLEHEKIKHPFIYPRSPKVNGVVERFNRTLQEEFINRCDEYWYNSDLGDQKLTHYLNWYNTTRPHSSLNYLTPLKFTEQYL